MLDGPYGVQAIVSRGTLSRTIETFDESRVSRGSILFEALLRMMDLLNASNATGMTIVMNPDGDPRVACDGYMSDGQTHLLIDPSALLGTDFERCSEVTELAVLYMYATHTRAVIRAALQKGGVEDITPQIVTRIAELVLANTVGRNSLYSLAANGGLNGYAFEVNYNEHQGYAAGNWLPSNSAEIGEFPGPITQSIIIDLTSNAATATHALPAQFAEGDPLVSQFMMSGAAALQTGWDAFRFPLRDEEYMQVPANTIRFYEYASTNWVIAVGENEPVELGADYLNPSATEAFLGAFAATSVSSELLPEELRGLDREFVSSVAVEFDF